MGGCTAGMPTIVCGCGGIAIGGGGCDAAGMPTIVCAGRIACMPFPCCGIPCGCMPCGCIEGGSGSALEGGAANGGAANGGAANGGAASGAARGSVRGVVVNAGGAYGGTDAEDCGGIDGDDCLDEAGPALADEKAAPAPGALGGLTEVGAMEGADAPDEPDTDGRGPDDGEIEGAERGTTDAGGAKDGARGARGAPGARGATDGLEAPFFGGNVAALFAAFAPDADAGAAGACGASDIRAVIG